MAELETKLPAVPGTDVPAAMFISPMASSFSADAAFGLTRVVARPYCKGSFVLACNAAGNWVPQQGPSAPVVFFQHGVNDTFTTGTNPLAQSGISGQYAQRSIEITNSQYNGGFSMKYSALILGIGIVQERIRRLAYSASVNVGATPFAGPYTAPGYVSRAGGIVNDNDWNLSDRLLSSILGASELQLLPMAQNTDCPLLLGVIQLFDSSRIGGMYGGPEVSQTTPDYRWRFALTTTMTISSLTVRIAEGCREIGIIRKGFKGCRLAKSRRRVSEFRIYRFKPHTIAPYGVFIPDLIGG
jgi:hypothetical protein